MKCINCQTDTNNPKFCSRSCSASYHNANQPKRKRSGKPCEHCGKTTLRKHVRYCSKDCRYKAEWEERKQEILETGIIHDENCFKTGCTTTKRFLTETKGYHCSICGINDWNDQDLVLVMDHINGIPNDWSVENLRFVCPNCDSQLPTYKSKNKGNGRPR